MQETEFQMLYDDSNIYIAIRAKESKMAAQVLVKEDNGRVWEDDSVEIFLQPGKKKYYRVGINALAKRSDTTVESASSAAAEMRLRCPSWR